MTRLTKTLFASGIAALALAALPAAPALADGPIVQSAEAAQAAPLQKAYVPEGSDRFWHRWFERKPIPLLIGSLVVVLIGTVIELIPTFTVQSNVPTIAAVQPYTPLELQGRDLYIREGCVGCHSQMVRPFRSETERYGEFPKSGEFVYDHPFLWGRNRNVPDLHRQGGKHPHFVPSPHLRPIYL